MSRSIREILEQILIAKSAVSTLSALEVLTASEQTLNDATSTSKVSSWRLFIWIIAYGIWNHERIVTLNAANSRPQNLPNYRDMVLSYIDGVLLVHSNGQFIFDTTGITDIEDRKIIKRCAIATEVGGVLQPVSNIQANRVLAYLNQQTQPGVAVRLINVAADKLKMDITFYVDPSVIDLDTGKQLNVTGDIYPAKDAIKNYLAKLEFNGGFVKSFFNTELESAAGVKIAKINSLEWKYASLPYVDAGIYRIPNSGYFENPEADLTINYLSNAVLE
jgi:hypothetical protein